MKKKNIKEKLSAGVHRAKNYLSMMSGATKLKCGIVILLAGVSAMLASSWPVQLSKLYTAISNEEYTSLQQCGAVLLLFGLVYLIAECLTIFRRVMLDCIIAEHEENIREKSIEKLLKMPASYHQQLLSGEKTAELNQGVAGFSQLIKMMCNDVFAAVFTAVCTLAQVAFHAPGLMAGIMMLYLIITVIISVFQIRSQNGIREDIIKQKNNLDGNICQSIQNLELIRCMNSESFEKQRFQPNIKKISNTEKKHHKYMGAFDSLKQLCKIFFQVLLLGLSVILIAGGHMESGAVITVCLLFQQLIKPIDELYRFMDETAASMIKTEALYHVLTGEEDDIYRMRENPVSPENNSIVFRNVTVTDPNRSIHLAKYSYVRISADTITALCGESGCGKTTFVRCINRYYPYISGKISVFGNPLEQYNQEELAESIFYVPQSTFFFAGTIRDNLAYGLKRPVTDEELYQAMEQACLLDNQLLEKAGKEGLHGKEILNLPVNEGAGEYSGGQRQRLAIARAFLRTPKLYIFDESTANLDAVTAGKVLDNIEHYAREHHIGVLYISHDANVVKRCQTIVQLQNAIVPTEQKRQVA